MHDPEFVDYAVYISERHGNGTVNKYPIGYHQCTEDDYAKFSTPIAGQEKFISNLKESNDLYCLDKTDPFGNPHDLNLYGSYKYGVTREISLLYRPCIPTTRTNTTENKCLIDDVKN